MRKVSKRLIAAFIAVLFCFSYYAQTPDTEHIKIELGILKLRARVIVF